MMNESAVISRFVDIVSFPAEATNHYPTLSQILVGLDTTSRAESAKIKATISQLHDFAKSTGLDATRFMQIAILIAFKRRNHDKSQAEGSGSGEKLLFLETLVAIAELREYDHLIISVLPLLPRYGCWRDLRQLAVILSKDLYPSGEDASIKPGQRGRLSASTSTTASSAMVEESHEKLMHPIVKLICDLFATTMHDDYHTDHPEHTPSNACKYAPHSKRSSGKHKDKNDGSKDSKAGKKRVLISDEIDAIEGGDNKRRKTPLNMINRMLAEEIEKSLCPQEYAYNHGEAAYRKIRAHLNHKLEVKGHLIEPLLCRKELDKIDFYRANKGSLQKTKKAIGKDEETMKRWRVAMSKSVKAVVDLDSLYDAIADYREDMKTEDVTARLFHYRVNKASLTLKKARKELVDKAKHIMLNAMDSSSSSSTISIPMVVAFVDTTGCATQDSRLAVILAGYLATKAMDLKFMIIDGMEVSLYATHDDGSEHENPWYDLHRMDDMEQLDVNVDPISAMGRLNSGIDISLRKLSSTSSTADGENSIDIVVFCKQVDQYNAAQDSFLETIKTYQTPSDHYHGMTIRTLRLHRLQRSSKFSSDGEIIYQPRRSRPTLPLIPVNITADVLFIVDFTGSMGSYMYEVKKQMISIIRDLKESTGIGSVRVGLIGYRDYTDADRIVRCDFYEQDDLSSLLAIIAGQQASGGGDAPEDLLSAMVCAKTLSWRSMVRLSVIITDADAHGCGPKDHDHYKSGKCPDQEAIDYPTISQATRYLATELMVDTFFCRMNPQPLDTEVVLEKEYADIGGFGVIGLKAGSISLKEQVIASLGTALVSSMVKEDVAGLQTTDGVSVGSLQMSINASIRESLAKYGDVDKVEKPAETDFERLVRELKSDDLKPVRYALQLPLRSDASSLAEQSANKMLESGITAAELEALDYPPQIISLLQKAAYASLSKL